MCFDLKKAMAFLKPQVELVSAQQRRTALCRHGGVGGGGKKIPRLKRKDTGKKGEHM